MSATVLPFPARSKSFEITPHTDGAASVTIELVPNPDLQKAIDAGLYARSGDAHIRVNGVRVATLAIESLAYPPIFQVVGRLDEGHALEGETYLVHINDLSFNVTAEEAARLIASRLFQAHDPSDDE